MLGEIDGRRPRLDPDTAFIAPTAVVIGDVHVGAGSSVWYGTVIRGDVHWIRIGRDTNIQDQCTLHVSSGTHPTEVGDEVTVGHRAVVHGCTIGPRCLVGIGAIVLDGAQVGEGSVIAAGALVTPRTRIPPGSLVVGAPARVKREVEPGEREWIAESARRYRALALKHAKMVLDPGDRVDTMGSGSGLTAG